MKSCGTEEQIIVCLQSQASVPIHQKDRGNKILIARHQSNFLQKKLQPHTTGVYSKSICVLKQSLATHFFWSLAASAHQVWLSLLVSFFWSLAALHLKFICLYLFPPNLWLSLERMAVPLSIKLAVFFIMELIWPNPPEPEDPRASKRVTSDAH